MTEIVRKEEMRLSWRMDVGDQFKRYDDDDESGKLVLDILYGGKKQEMGWKRERFQNGLLRYTSSFGCCIQKRCNTYQKIIIIITI